MVAISVRVAAAGWLKSRDPVLVPTFRRLPTGRAEPYGERCALSEPFAKCRQRAAVRFNECLADAQPDTGATSVAVPSRVDAVEPVEDMGQVLGCDAFARVGDRELDPTTLPAAAQCDAGAGWCVSQGVVEQVTQDLADPIEVSQHRVVSVQVGVEADTLRGKAVLGTL